VYPPIPVEDWTVEDLPERIEGVRQIYLDTLKSWPHDRLPEFDIYSPPDAAKKVTPKNAANKAKAGNAAKKAPAKGRP
jgi:putative phosphoserine phosphatase/1-acylglycerol-3-phosphate O-acyltransferase